MNCLLIDDDIPTLEALQQILDGSGLGITQTYKVTNIYDAINVLKTQSIDLMLCDIEMPRGSGLELLKWTYETKQTSRFIFLTCHDNFEFASEAIQYKVDAYLLKPLDPVKIKTAVEKSIQRLHEQMETAKNQQLSVNWMKNKEVVEHSFWRDIIMGNIYPDLKLISAEAEKRSLEKVNIDQRYYINLLRIDTTHLIVSWEEGLFLAALTNITEEILSEHCNLSQLFTYKQEDICFVCYLLPDTYTQEEQHAIGTSLIQACQQFLRVESTVFISKDVKIDRLLQTRNALEQLYKNNLAFLGGVHFFDYERQSDNKIQFQLNYDTYLLLFQAKDKVKLANKIKEDLDVLLANSNVDLDKLVSIREDLLQVCYSYLSSHDIQAHCLFVDHASKSLYSRANRSIYDFMKWAFYVCDQSIELVKETKKVTGVLENALDYIHNNYYTNLSREDIAASVYLNPDYFTKLFKQKIGKSLTEYINDYRIKVAKKLLVETEMAISLVAMETGFENISYFSTIFKKVTGMTPNHFRTSVK